MIAAAMLVLVQCRGGDATGGTAPPPIEIRGNVHPGQSITLSTQIDGTVESLALREGAAVGPGTVIAELSNPAIERDLALARTELQWIELRLGGGTGSPGAGWSGDALRIAARILELRRQRFERMKDLRGSNDVTERDLEQAEIEYLAALRDYENQRRAGLAQPAPDDLGRLHIERDKVLVQVRFAEQRRELLRVSSPIAGTLTRIHVTPGQIVFPREAIAEVANLSTLQVRGSVPSELVRYLAPGTPVEVRVIGVPTRTFADEIDYVIPAQGTGSQARGATVVVTIPNPDGRIQVNTEAGITLRSAR